MARALAGVDDPVTIGPLALAGTSVVVHTNDGDLAQRLGDLLASLPRTEQAQHTVWVLDRGGERDRRWMTVIDDEVFAAAGTADGAMQQVATELNQMAVAGSVGSILLHAGAVERDGRAVVVVGESGRGKSTLTAALVRDGFAYLTDELVQIDPVTLRVAPVPEGHRPRRVGAAPGGCRRRGQHQRPEALGTAGAAGRHVDRCRSGPAGAARRPPRRRRRRRAHPGGTRSGRGRGGAVAEHVRRDVRPARRAGGDRRDVRLDAGGDAPPAAAGRGRGGAAGGPRLTADGRQRRTNRERSVEAPGKRDRGWGAGYCRLVARFDTKVMALNLTPPTAAGGRSGTRRWRRQVGLGAKRAFDVVVAVAVLVVLSPLYALIALMILVVDGRPVIFRQTRLGRDSEPFTIYKFRTMTRDAEAQRAAIEHQNERHGPLFKMVDDPRITRSGRWLRRTSLDELPQFWNVVEGSMSIVGPRPALPSEAEQFPAELRRRELMPQGITGLWQLDGQTDPDFGKYTDLDLRYVDEWSFRLDLSIFVRTIPVVLETGVPVPDPGAAASVERRRPRTAIDEVEPPAPSQDPFDGAGDAAPRSGHVPA